MKWQAAVDQAVRPFGITHAQYSLLASLRGLTSNGSRPSQRELADHLGLDPVFVSKLIATLEAAGSVSRSKHPDDSRAVALSLTKRGIATIDPAIEAVGSLQEQLIAPLGGVDSARTRQLTATLQRLLATPLSKETS
jgi:DNA-binding MarR family transcriptional regulator